MFYYMRILAVATMMVTSIVPSLLCGMEMEIPDFYDTRMRLIRKVQQDFSPAIIDQIDRHLKGVIGYGRTFKDSKKLVDLFSLERRQSQEPYSLQELIMHLRETAAEMSKAKFAFNRFPSLWDQFAHRKCIDVDEAWKRSETQNNEEKKYLVSQNELAQLLAVFNNLYDLLEYPNLPVQAAKELAFLFDKLDVVARNYTNKGMQEVVGTAKIIGKRMNRLLIKKYLLRILPQIAIIGTTVVAGAGALIAATYFGYKKYKQSHA